MKNVKTIKIIIERSDDAFSAYAENVQGIYGMGDNVEDAKQAALNGLSLFVKHNKPENIPDILKEGYEIVYKFDTESFLNHYKKIFTNAALERMTGINQKQLQHYSTGLKKPRPAQIKKIKTAMHNLGKELMALDL